MGSVSAQLPYDLFLIRHGEIIGKDGVEKLARIRAGEYVENFPLFAGVPEDKGLTDEGKAQVAAIDSWLDAESPGVFGTRKGDLSEYSFWMCDDIPGNTRTHETAYGLGVPHALWQKTDLL